jgi:hypothetical protein
MAERRGSQPITVSKSELAFLNAIIEYTREVEQGSAETVTVYVEPQLAAIWAKALVKAGKWAWQNRYKLVAVTEAVWDLIGGDVFANPRQDQQYLDAVRQSAQRDLPLQDLLALREQIDRGTPAPPEPPADDIPPSRRR